MAAIRSQFGTHDHNLPTSPKVLRHSYNPFFRIKRTTFFVSCNFKSTCSFNSHKELIVEPFERHLPSSNDHLQNTRLVNEMIKDYTNDGSYEDAIRLYLGLLDRGFPAAGFKLFPYVIKAFGGLCDVQKCRQVHGHVLKLGVLDNIYVVNSVLSMHWKCELVEDAILLFKKMNEKDLVTWNTMISGFNQSMCFVEALVTFRKMMLQCRMSLTRVSCVSALSSCASLKSLMQGREIHAYALKGGLDIDAFLVSGLIEMYMKCEDVGSAEVVFRSHLNEDSAKENVVVWNVMILGYVSNDLLSQALNLFLEMLHIGLKPDSSSMVAALVMCSQSLNLAVGRQLHCLFFIFGLHNDVRVETAMLDMYFKCGDVKNGLKIFQKSQNRNLVMWTAVLSNSTHSNHPCEALKLFHGFMLDFGSLDSGILLTVLRACSSLTHKPRGMEIHGLTVKEGLDSDIFIGSAIVDMYAKCKDVESATKVFDRMRSKDVISWNALIAGYCQSEETDQALKLFCNMQLEHVKPNAVTLSSILSVCADLTVNNWCKEIHGFLIRQGFDSNVLVSNALIATYAKCGDIYSCRMTFEKMTERNEVSWNSVILGLGMHNEIDEMFVTFENMKATGVKPDHITFTAILSACSHSGRLDDGWKYFHSMIEDYEIEPRVEHYTCLVDLLGRAGHLKWAYDLILAMPCSPDEQIWGSLLSSCKTHADELLARVVANHIFELDPSSIGYRVLLANLSKEFGKVDEVARIRSEIKDMGLKKKPGCSWVQVDNTVHIFVASDQSHPQANGVYAALVSLTLELMGAGYVPRIDSEGGEVDETYDVKIKSTRMSGTSG